jgi:YegS/Rv2252/BmrU family lipid kinase
MRIVVIANPRAGRGRARRLLAQFERAAERLGEELEMRWSAGPGHASEIARACAAHADVVCVAGGDGTVHEVVNGLMPHPPPITVLPVGTGNDFARMFGFARTPDELLRVVRAGEGARLDVIECGGRYAANGVGIGFEALVTRESRSLRGPGGMLLYLAAVFKALARYDCPSLRIEIDGHETIAGERLLVSLGNGPTTGGGFRLNPDAHPDDGYLDACIVEGMGRARVLRLLPASTRGAHVGRDGVVMRRCREIAVSGARAFHMHLDGEYVGEQAEKLRFRVIERALPVLFAGDRPARLSRPRERIRVG